jgi:hypothetical protein
MKIEKSVYDRVVAITADYSRMQKLIGSGELTREQTATFVKELTAIDNALTVVCDREREEVKRALLVDIAERRGYERSVSRSVFGSKKVFDRRKGQAVILIARMLDLI